MSSEHEQAEHSGPEERDLRSLLHSNGIDASEDDMPTLLAAFRSYAAKIPHLYTPSDIDDIGPAVMFDPSGLFEVW